MTRLFLGRPKAHAYLPQIARPEPSTMQIHPKPYLQDYGGGATYRTLGEGLYTGLWGRDYLQDNDGGETYRTVAKGYLKNYRGEVTYRTMGKGLLTGLEVTETTASTKPLPQHGSKSIKPGNLEHNAQSADSSIGC